MLAGVVLAGALVVAVEALVAGLVPDVAAATGVDAGVVAGGVELLATWLACRSAWNSACKNA